MVGPHPFLEAVGVRRGEDDPALRRQKLQQGLHVRIQHVPMLDHVVAEDHVEPPTAQLPEVRHGVGQTELLAGEIDAAAVVIEKPRIPAELAGGQTVDAETSAVIEELGAVPVGPPHKMLEAPSHPLDIPFQSRKVGPAEAEPLVELLQLAVFRHWFGPHQPAGAAFV